MLFNCYNQSKIGETNYVKYRKFAFKNHGDPPNNGRQTDHAGMRITVEQILRALSGGVSEQELLEEYPELEREDFQAVFAYVTGLVEEERVFAVGVHA